MVRPLMSKKKAIAAQQLLEQAMNFHRMGLLAEAEQLYRQALETKPRDAQVQHMLGVLRAQQDRLDEALELVSAALRSNPSSFVAASDLGLILHKLGRDAEALSRFDLALAIRADYAPALSNR